MARCIGGVVVSFICVLLSLGFVSFVALDWQPRVSSTLRLVSVVFRHGDRNPTDTYPNDPHRNDSRWSDGWGALTKLGMQQMYSLGTLLRRRYDRYRFLNDRYSADELYVVSSDHDRCLMSAQVLLAGLYPPKGDQLWNRDLPWQPIPVHTIPKRLDQLIVMRKPCPSYDAELNQTYSSDFVREIDSNNADLYRYLTEKTGKPVNGVLDVESLYNTLEIEERNNLKLPLWTDGIYPEKMKDLAALSLALFTFTDKQKRLKGGPLINDIVEHFTQKFLGTLKPNRKIFLYSGHDLNLVSSFRVLGFSDLKKPENGASLLFELHQAEADEEPRVKLLYLKNTEQALAEELQIPNCEAPCTLRKFSELTSPFRPVNWDEECRLR